MDDAAPAPAPGRAAAEPAPEPGAEPWRAVVAALADPRSRRELARIIAATDPTPGPHERRAARDVLRRAGLITLGDRIDEKRIAALLAQGRPPAEHGVAPWLRADGRIERLPRGEADRLIVLEWILVRVIGTDEVLDEKEVTARLFPVTPDPSTVRRALVDAGLVRRNPDGTGYRRGGVGS